MIRKSSIKTDENEWKSGRNYNLIDFCVFMMNERGNVENFHALHKYNENWGIGSISQSGYKINTNNMKSKYLNFILVFTKKKIKKYSIHWIKWNWFKSKCKQQTKYGHCFVFSMSMEETPIQLIYINKIFIAEKRKLIDDNGMNRIRWWTDKYTTMMMIMMMAMVWYTVFDMVN